MNVPGLGFAKAAMLLTVAALIGDTAGQHAVSEYLIWFVVALSAVGWARTLVEAGRLSAETRPLAHGLSGAAVAGGGTMTPTQRLAELLADLAALLAAERPSTSTARLKLERIQREAEEVAKQ